SISAIADNGTFMFSPALDSFLQGTEVEVTAIGNLGYGFDSWSGDISGTKNPATIVMDGDKTISAEFVEVPVYSLNLIPEYGLVTLNPPGGKYNNGTVVTLTPEANPGYYFEQWMGDLVGTENPATITMDLEKTINARFVYAGFGQTQKAINFGGPEYVAEDGTNYSGDTNGSNYSTSANISGTVDEKLYQTERFGNNFSIEIPVDNGTYRITLMFAEIYWDEPGKRVFDVSIEGEEVIRNLDIYTEVGKNAAFDKTFEVIVTDGEMNIGFSASVNNAKISALKIVNNNYEGETFNLVINNPGNGNVNTNPSEESYPAGSNVLLTAIPDTGFMFTGWSGDLTGSENPVTLHMNEEKNVSASFAATNWYTLSASATNGTILLHPEKGIYGYTEGTVVSLSAIPDTGYYFSGWIGDLEGIDTSTTTLIMDADKNVRANFEKKQFFTLSADASNGSIVLIPAGGNYEEGTVVTLTAVPNTGFTFNGWQGDLSGTENPKTVTMDTAKTVVAKFSNPNALKLTVNSINGSIQATPDQDSYFKGASVILVATPKEGYQFTEWEGDLTGSSNPVGFIITADMDITAVFSKITAISDVRTDNPKQTILMQNYPNPFSGTTNIPYQLSGSSLVKLQIFNLLGEIVTTLVNEFQHPGHFTVEWNAEGFKTKKTSSSIYFYSLETDGNVVVKKMILDKQIE
ncbi:MAG TPA: malectin domain-containing carbohydrate-binding protein, partial [Draconibacterium sp.]|nr:malectin domain-containing carbohydrate-binding protein [Draconibacterium sp.]